MGLRTLLDTETIARIRELGGLGGDRYLASAFLLDAHGGPRLRLPVYPASEDQQWTAQRSEHQAFVDGTEMRIRVGGEDTGVTVIKLGGHFPGSLAALFDGHLMIADTLLTTRSGVANWSVDALGARARRQRGRTRSPSCGASPTTSPRRRTRCGGCGAS